MPGETEKVSYSYVGDVVSLKKATKDALGLLSQYQAEITRLSSVDAFGKNSKASTSFQSSVKAVNTQVTKLEKQLKAVSDVKKPSFSTVLGSTNSGLESISKVYDKLKNSTSLTTKEVRALAMQLRTAKEDLKSNSSAVESLVTKEVRFQGTLAKLRDTSTSLKSSMDKIQGSVSRAFDPMLTKLNSLRNPFESAITRLQAFKSKAQESFGRVKQLLDALTSAFRRTEQSEDDVADSAKRVKRTHDDLSDSLEELPSEVGNSSDEFSDFGSGLKSVIGSITKLLPNTKKLSHVFRDLTSSVFGSTSILSKLKALITSLGLVEATKQSINYTENLNLFKVALGEATEVGIRFVTQMQELFGMDPSTLMRYAGNFYQLADAISMPDEAAAKLSLGLTKATNDIASLFNVDVETVFENLSSGMQGMSRAVRKYGMDIRTVTLQQTALSLGITDSVTNMSEANRQGLRFITMMRQAENASGDFAKTIEQPANQLRIFKEQMSQLGRAVGNLFIRPLSQAIQYINGFVMALRVAITFIGSLLGYTEDLSSTVSVLKDTSASIESIGSSAGSAAKKLNKLLAPFDELNVLQAANQASGEGGISSDLDILDPKILEAINQTSWALEDVKMKANEVRDSILKFLGFTTSEGKITFWDADAFEQNLIEKLPGMAALITVLFEQLNPLVEGFISLMRAVGEVVTAVFDKLESVWGSDSVAEILSVALEGLSQMFSSVAEFLDSNAQVIADAFLFLIPALVAFGAITSVLSTIGISISEVVVALTALGAADAVTPFMEIVAVVLLVVTAIGSLGAALITLMTIYPPLAGSIVSTFESVYSVITSIVASLQQAFTDLWTNTLQPTSQWVLEALKATGELVNSVWVTVIDPIIQSLGKGFEDLWVQTLQPIFMKVIDVIFQLIDLFQALWVGVLQPILDWIVIAFGPSISDTIDSLVSSFVWLADVVGSIIIGLLTVLEGLLSFLTGVFSGDWTRVWSSLVNILIGLLNSLVGALNTVLGAISATINSLIAYIWNAIKLVINAVSGAVQKIAAALNISLDLTVRGSAPQIPVFKIPTVEPIAMATGGVVTSPTFAQIGEGHYSEAVIPLGNSPQMKELVNQIANAVNRDRDFDSSVPIQITLDGQIIYEDVVRRVRRDSIQTGFNPILGG